MKPYALAIALFLLAAAPAVAQETPAEKSSRTEMRVSVKDSTRGLTFELHPDGKVELTVAETEPDGAKREKTYKADSLDDFKKKHPEIARQYQIDRFVPRVQWGRLNRASEKAWEEWKKWFEEDWFWDHGRDFRRWFGEWWLPFQSDDLDNWVEEQRKLFEKFRDLRAPRDPGEPKGEAPTSSPAFGLRIDAVNETLATQLDLKPGEGVLVIDVRDGTPAHKAGVRKHDIIVTLSGKAVTDRGEFRRQLRDLAGQAFEMDVVRRGRRETIKVGAGEK